MDLAKASRYQIRLASEEDVAELVRMQLALQRSMARIGTNMFHLHRSSVGRLHDYYQTQITDGLTRLLVAQDGVSDDVVGMGTGKIWLHADYVPARSGEWIDLWVDPEHRRRGLAEQIVTRLLTFFRVNRVEFLAVNYVQANPPAERLWKKLGFKPVLMTATAERREIESTLGLGAPRIVPLEGHSAATNRRAYAGIGLSG